MTPEKTILDAVYAYVLGEISEEEFKEIAVLAARKEQGHE